MNYTDEAERIRVEASPMVVAAQRHLRRCEGAQKSLPPLSPVAKVPAQPATAK